MPNKATIFITFFVLFIALIANKHDFIRQTIEELFKMYRTEFDEMSLLRKTSIKFVP